MNKKRVIIIIIAVLCVIACLIGIVCCVGPRVTGIKSLAAANYKAQSKVKSYHMDGTVKMEIALNPEELPDIPGLSKLKIPVKMTIDANAGNESAHIVTDASVKFFDKSVTLQTAEAYLDLKNQVAYTKTGDSREWKKSGDEEEQMEFRDLAGGLAMVGKTVLENAVFTETEEFYTVTMPAEKAGDLVTDLRLLDQVDLGVGKITDISIEGGELVYNVDKETLLVSSIELKDVDIRGTGTYEEMAVGLKFPLNGTFRFSRYNELEESEYAIPEEVTAGK